LRVNPSFPGKDICQPGAPARAGMAKRQVALVQAMDDRRAVLLPHRLKWPFQPGLRVDSWRLRIEESGIGWRTPLPIIPATAVGWICPIFQWLEFRCRAMSADNI